MNQPSRQELERRFAEGGISARLLYPWWYRALRTVGMGDKPPVLYRWSEHLLYTGSSVAAVLIVGGTVLWLVNQADGARLLPMAVLVLVIPAMNWFRYGRIRRRLGL